MNGKPLTQKNIFTPMIVCPECGIYEAFEISWDLTDCSGSYMRCINCEVIWESIETYAAYIFSIQQKKFSEKAVYPIPSKNNSMEYLAIPIGTNSHEIKNIFEMAGVHLFFTPHTDAGTAVLVLYNTTNIVRFDSVAAVEKWFSTPDNEIEWIQGVVRKEVEKYKNLIVEYVSFEKELGS